MDIISSTGNSKFPRRAPSQISPERDGDNVLMSRNESTDITDQDELFLSEETKRALKSLGTQLNEVISDNPRYAQLFFASSKASPLRQLNFASSLFQLPQYQALLNRDPEFMEFYRQIEQLGSEYQATLHRFQDYLRSSKPLTYSKPPGLNPS